MVQDISVADALHKYAVALRRARSRMGWSQRDLARRSGIPQPHISRIEAGAVDPKLSTLLELVRTLEMDVVLVPRQALNPVLAIVRDTEQPGPVSWLDRPAYSVDDEEED